MPIETIDLMVDAGKAVPGPAVAQKLGPMGINIGEVINKINKKTESFKGMQVPVKLKIDTKAKEVSDIEVGTPPTTQLIKKELNLEKGSGKPDKEKVANISIEQCIKIAKMKRDAMYTSNLKQAVKTVAGSCNSLGVLVEGKTSNAVIQDIDNGKYDKEISEEKTDLQEQKKKLLQQQLQEVQAELAKQLEKLKAAKQKEAPPAEQPEAQKEEIKEEKKEVKKEEVKKK